jgi:ring-1,2-phenylacetyl-CoA epoxidase subunit PaaD
MDNLKSEQIWEALQEVKDPEIPVVSVVEMGMIRNIGVERGRVIVTMTPTFAGCPALEVMQTNIEQRLRQEGVEEVRAGTAPPAPGSA